MLALIRHTHAKAAFGLIAIVILQVLFRIYLDDAQQYLDQVYLERYYHNRLDKLFHSHPWWYIFFPVAEIKGTWCTTGFLLLYGLESTIGPFETYLLISALSTIAFGSCVWWCSRSSIATLFAASALAFSPFNYSVYLWNGSNNSYTLIFFLSIAALCQFQVVFRQGDVRWKSASIFFVVLSAISYEIWLNYVVYLIVAAPIVAYFYLYLDQRKDVISGLKFVFFSTVSIAALYVAIRWQYLDNTFIPGREAQFLTDYETLGPALDDLIYNIFFYFYLTISQIMPGFVATSAAIYETGTLDIAKLTFGYQPDLYPLVADHFRGIWLIYSAVLFCLCVYVCVFLFRQMRISKSPVALCVLLLLLPALLGSPTHSLLKFVAFNAVPFYSYKVTVGVVSMCILYGVLADALLKMRFANHNYVRASLVTLLSMYLAIVAFTRPYWANENIYEIWGEPGFFANGFYPDPWERAKALLTKRD